MKKHEHLDQLYLDYINGNELAFSKLLTNLKRILQKKFKSNKFFTQERLETFDDIFQQTSIKLWKKKDTFDHNKGNVVTLAYIIFLNKLRDASRRKKNKSIYISRCF